MNRSERRRATKLSKTSTGKSTRSTPAPALPVPSEDLQQLFTVGKQQHAAGNLSKAAEAYAHILKIEPNQPAALYLLGVAFLQSGQHQKAVELLKQSLSAFPDHAEAYNNLGVAYNASGNTADAEKSYRQAISLNPKYAGAFKNLGALLASKGDLDAALECYQTTTNLVPNLAEAHKAIADIFLMQQKYENAAESYFKANALAPMDANILTSLGISLQFLSRPREALKFHSQAVNIATSGHQHWTAFGDCVSGMSFSGTNDSLITSSVIGEARYLTSHLDFSDHKCTAAAQTACRTTRPIRVIIRQ